ncbi:class F sortase [Streptomyces sp. SCSIO 30461]|uniref:class F sortase n=1 Tax=Streptomyces sp. SCSIO 30461 TaxID=3118085 RepID=UPI0030D0A44D
MPTAVPSERRARAAQRHTHGSSRRILIFLVPLGIWLLVRGLIGESPPQPFSDQSGAHGSGSSAADRAAVHRAAHTLPRSTPVRLRIPAVHIDASMTTLALDGKGALQLPPPGSSNLAGWYSRGPAPGEAGAAIVAGHVDTPTGPAVFYSLGALRKKSTVEITRKDRRTAVFSVDAVEVYAKRSFPSRKVYGGGSAPQLRIVTCGGGYRKSTGYQGNLVVYASLVRVR